MNLHRNMLCGLGDEMCAALLDLQCACVAYIYILIDRITMKLK